MIESGKNLTGSMPEMVTLRDGEKIQIWKTLELGKLNADQYRAEFARAGMSIEKGAEHMFQNISIESSAKSIRLIVTSVGDMGFSEPVTYDDIHARALAKGLVNLHIRSRSRCSFRVQRSSVG